MKKKLIPSEEIEEDLKSKSEIKREMHQLQVFAEELVNMSKHQRSRLPLSEDLLYAMVVADKIANKHEAMRRHIRHIGKILLETDLEPIHQAIAVMANIHQQESVKHIKLEQLRDKLISQGALEIENLIAEHPQIDRQKLRQLVRQAAKEVKVEKPAKYYQTLLKYLKTEVKF